MTHSREKEVYELYHNFPTFIQQIITIDEWKLWDNPYQYLFKRLFYHPNVFFYTERPPFEMHNNDDNFTRFEQQQLLIRQDYFLKNYGRVYTLIGYFAIPFTGRSGIKISSFYLQYIRLGLLKDSTISFDDDDLVVFKAPPMTTAQLEKLKYQTCQELIPVIKRMRNFMNYFPTITKEVQKETENLIK